MKINHLTKSIFFIILILGLVMSCVAPISAEYTTFNGDISRNGDGDPLNIIHLDSEYVFTTGDFNPSSDSVFANFEDQKVLVKLTDFFSLNNPTTAKYSASINEAESVYDVENTQITGSPSVYNGYIYYGTSSGIACYDIKEKKNVWSYNECGAVFSGVTIEDRRVWFGTASGKLCSIDLDGTNFKSTDVIDSTQEYGLTSTPLVIDGVAYVTTKTPVAFQGYSITDLTNIVSIPINSGVAIFSSPSFGDGTIYFSGFGGISSYNIDDGGKLILETDGETGTPVYHNGWIYATTKSTLYGICLEDNAKSWSVHQDGFATSPIITDKLVVSNNRLGITAYDAKTGEVKWTHDALDSASSMLSVPYAVDKELPVYELYSVSPTSPVRSGDIIFYSANFGQSADSGRSIIFGVNIDDGRDCVPAALDKTSKYRYHFSVNYATANSNMIEGKKNAGYYLEISPDVYQAYLKSANNLYSTKPTTATLGPTASKILSKFGTFTDDNIKQTLTSDGTISSGTKSGKIYDYVYPYCAVVENSWITTASPVASDGYLIAGYTTGESGALILHGAKTISLYYGSISMHPTESTLGLSVADATPLGILEKLKIDNKIINYTTDDNVLTAINGIENNEGSQWSILVDNIYKEDLTYELTDKSTPQSIVFAYGSNGNVDYTVTVNALIRTENIGQEVVKIPSGLYVGETDIPYTSVYGAMLTLKDSKILSFTTTDNIESLTSLNTIQNSENNVWYLRNSGTTSTLKSNVEKNNQVIFYYGPKDQVEKAIYSFSITISEIISPMAKISFDEAYGRKLIGDSDDSISIIVLNWKGDVVTQYDGDISWTYSNTDNFTYTISDDSKTVTYVLKEGKDEGETFITATYSPTIINGDKVISPESQLLTTTSDKISASILKEIPTDPSIEKTINYITSHGNYARNGVVNGTGPLTNVTLWSYNFLDKASGYIPLVDGDPIVYNGNVYFTIWGSGGMTGQDVSTSTTGELKNVDGLYCFDATNGELKWHRPELISRGGLAANNSTIYGGTTEINHAGKLFAVNADTGNLKWETEQLCGYSYTGLASAPLVYNDKIYVLARSATATDVTNTLYVFVDNVDSAEEIANISLDHNTEGVGVAERFATVSVSPDGTIYAPGKGGVVAIDSKDYSINWACDVGLRGAKEQGGNQKFVGTPVYNDQKVYFATTGSIWCVNALTGKEIWHDDNEAIKASTPVITDNGKVIVSGGEIINHQRYGLSIYDTDGNLLRRTTEGQLNYASPVVAENIAYFGTFNDASIFAVDVETGENVWKYTLPEINKGWLSLVEALPAIENGVLYVGGEDGKFYAFGSTESIPFSINGPSSVEVGVNATFTTSTGDAYSWDFGDTTSTSGNAKVVKHAWKQAGTYSVKASYGANVATFAVNVTTPPKPLDEGASTKVDEDNIIIKSPATPVEGMKTSPDSGDIELTFSNDVLNTTASEAIIVLKVSEYLAVTDADAKVTLDSERYTTPPDISKTIFLMNVTDVSNITQNEGGDGAHIMDVMAKLVVKLNVTKDTAKNISFWRYVDGDKNPRPLASSVGQITDGTGVAEDEMITVEYVVNVPGFSTIIAAVDNETAVIVNPPGGEGGGGDDPITPSPTPSINYVDVDPGSGTFEYTTNHPDWPAVTFKVDWMSAFGVLIASGNSVVAAERWGGIYVDSINGKSPSDDTEGWMYQVNGVAPGSMANNYPVHVGDKVVWYFSKDMSDPVEKSPQIYAFNVVGTGEPGAGGASNKTKEGEELKIEPATTSEIKVTLPDSITITTSGVGQNIRLEESVADGNTISIQDNKIQIKSPGLLITIETTGMITEDGVVTAKVQEVIAEFMPSLVSIPVNGLEF